MPQGLQVFEENGKCILDIATITTELIGFANTGKSNGSIKDSKLIGKRVWCRVISSDISGIDVRARPKFSFNDDTISWKFEVQSGAEMGPVPDCKFMYGVY